MHVQGALGRALDQPSHLALHAAVAVGVDQLHVAKGGVRVEPDRERHAPGRADRRAALGDVGRRLDRAAARLGAHLDLGQECLVTSALERELHPLDDPLGRVLEPEPLAVDEQQLLLEPDGEGLAAAEAVVHAGLQRRPSREAAEHQRRRQPAGVAARRDATGVRAAGEHARRRLRVLVDRQAARGRGDAGDALDRHAAGVALHGRAGCLGRRDHLPHAALAHALLRARRSPPETRRGHAAGAPSTAVSTSDQVAFSWRSPRSLVTRAWRA